MGVCALTLPLSVSLGGTHIASAEQIGQQAMCWNCDRICVLLAKRGKADSVRFDGHMRANALLGS
jgi:hypothetical protein